MNHACKAEYDEYSEGFNNCLKKVINIIDDTEKCFSTPYGINGAVFYRIKYLVLALIPPYRKLQNPKRDNDNE